jgi:predicted nucleic acid-binding protein
VRDKGLETKAHDVLPGSQSTPTNSRWRVLSEDGAARSVADVSVLAEVVSDPPAASRPENPDPKDEFLVALARVANAVALISGDPHLTDLVHLEPPVVTPARFVDRLQD